MSKVKEGAKIFGTTIFGLVYLVGSLAIGLVMLYFGIKFVINTGDRFFGKDESSSSVQDNKEDLEYQESYYVGVCTEELIKRAGEGDQDKMRSYCKCLYNSILDAAGSKENFVTYQNTVDEDKIAEISAPCREEYGT